LGIDRLASELAKLGHAHSPKRVRRLARAAGLTGLGRPVDGCCPWLGTYSRCRFSLLIALSQ
jgi:hypothetical protein